MEVQVLVDGLNGGGRPLSSSDLFCQLAAHENVEVRLYNPLNLLAPLENQLPDARQIPDRR